MLHFLQTPILQHQLMPVDTDLQVHNQPILLKTKRDIEEHENKNKSSNVPSGGKKITISLGN